MEYITDMEYTGVILTGMEHAVVDFIGVEYTLSGIYRGNFDSGRIFWNDFLPEWNTHGRPFPSLK